jgi:hypothetical protein
MPRSLALLRLTLRRVENKLLRRSRNLLGAADVVRAAPEMPSLVDLMSMGEQLRPRERVRTRGDSYAIDRRRRDEHVLPAQRRSY